MTEKTLPEQNQTSDVFTSTVMSKIDYFVNKSDVDKLSPEQRSIIEMGVSACKPKGHAIDIRGVLPFHFARLYYVLLIGRDQRSMKKSVAHDIRQRTKPIAHLLYWLTAIWPVYVVVYFVYWFLNNLPPLFRG